MAGIVWWFAPVFSLPEPSGRDRVGVQAFDLTDTARHGLLGTEAEQPRRIPIRVWYPAAARASGSVRPYLPAYQARSLGETFGEGRYAFAYLRFVKTHSVDGAPAKAGGGDWPLVLFNHGFWSYPEQNTAMMELLASHGYVVVSIGHPGDSVETRFPDGTVVRPFYDRDAPAQLDANLEAGTAAFMGGTDDDARFAGLPRFEAGAMAHRIGASARIWREDDLFVLRALQQRSVPPALARLADRMDFDRVAVVGMSFGGSTAPSVCQRLSSCRAAVNLDGESFDFAMYNQDLHAPLLLILTGQLFNSSQLNDPGVNPTDFAYERWARTGERADVFRMRVPALRHIGLMDLPLSAPRPSHARLYGAIDGVKAVELVNHATLDFLDTYVRGESRDFPKAFYAGYPEAQPHDASHVRRWWIERNGMLGCAADRVLEAAPENDPQGMRLGPWIHARSACDAGTAARQGAKP